MYDKAVIEALEYLVSQVEDEKLKDSLLEKVSLIKKISKELNSMSLYEGTGISLPFFNRFDIFSAYSVFECNYPGERDNQTIVNREVIDTSSQLFYLCKIYVPDSVWPWEYEELSDNAQAIYRQLKKRFNLGYK